MKNYNHLTLEQRYDIQTFIAEGLCFKEIAERLSIHLSTLYREVKRNADQRSGRYQAKLAERKCRDRHRIKPKRLLFTETMRERVATYLKEDYSPEQVAGVLKAQGQPCVSHERIYQYIWNDKRTGGSLYTHLRRRGKRYRKRGSLKDHRGLIPNRVDIEKRPKVVEKKARLGDLEVDTIIGKGHKGAIVTLNCRASGVLKMKLVHTKEALPVSEAVIALLQDWKPLLHTITADNGKEFSSHQKISEALAVDFYFAEPYHAWQRGANENLNGLVRQYIPKQTDFSTLSSTRIKEIQDKINQRPRKRYNFRSPDQVFAEHLDKKLNFALTN